MAASPSSSPSVFFFPCDWRFGDYPSGNGNGSAAFRIVAFGRLEDGRSACVSFAYTPHFFVDCRGWGSSKIKGFISDAVRDLGAVPAKTCVIQRKSIWGFTNGMLRPFICLGFETLKQWRNAKYAYERAKVQTYEANLDSSMPLLRFFHTREIKPAAWMRLERAVAVKQSQRLSFAEVELAVEDPQWVHPATAEEVRSLGQPDLQLCSWDIETNSSIPGKFPDATLEDDTCFMIGASLKRWKDGDDAIRKIIITAGPCDPVEGVEVIAAEDEAGCIREFAKLLRREGVDVLMGWNTSGFDWKYVHVRRSEVLLDEDNGESMIDPNLFGKLKDGGGAYHVKNLSSAAYGDNAMTRIECPGIFDLDLMVHIKKVRTVEGESTRGFETYVLSSLAGNKIGLLQTGLCGREVSGAQQDRSPTLCHLYKVSNWGGGWNG